MKKQHKNGLLRIMAMLLALVMIVGDPVSALAAEKSAGANDAATEAESDVVAAETDEATVDDVADVEDEDELSPQLIEALKASAEAAAAEETDVKVEDADPAAVKDEMPDDVSPIQFLDKLGLSADDVQQLGAKNVTGTYTAVRYKNRVSVKNDSTAAKDSKEDALYAALIYRDDKKKNIDLMWGTKIPAGQEASIFTAYDENGKRVVLDETTDYVLLIGRGMEWEVTDEEGNVTGTEVSDFGIMGYVYEYDDDGNPKINEETGDYVINEIGISEKTDLPASTIVTESASTEWKDGYTGINMKAVVQANMTVKISWSPNSKDEMQKTFKKFELFELTPDGDEYKETPIPLKSASSKSVVHSAKVNAEEVKDTYIYLLKCYEKNGTTPKAEYVTITAPYLITVESGSQTGMFDFVFTQMPENNSVFYRLEMAVKNKEMSEKVPNGFQEAWSTIYSSDDSLDFNATQGTYYISKKVSAMASKLTYDSNVLTFALGSTYYGRVQAFANIRGLSVTSAPTAAKKVKAGPDRTYVIDTAGIKYDAKDPTGNTRRATAHISSAFSKDAETEEVGSDIYVHGSNSQVCAKSGMFFFVGHDDESQIKSYELLRSTSENGPYKKVKTYAIKSLIKCKVEDSDTNMNVYAAQYAAFTPEQEYWYKIRAISKTGSAPGGLSMAEFVQPEEDCVQGAATISMSASKISIEWEHDDCVKQYWIYRSATPYSGTEARTEATGTPIAKVKGTSFKKLTYTDDENNKITYRYHQYNDKSVESDVKYYYYVRPIIDTTKAASNGILYMGKISAEVMGKATPLFQAIGGFKAANYCAGKNNVTFNQAKNVNHYRVWRLRVGSSTSKLTDAMKPNVFDIYNEATDGAFDDWLDAKDLDWWKSFMSTHGGTGSYNWEFVAEISTDGNSTKAKSFRDNGVTPGRYYFYLIQGATDKSSSAIFSYSSRVYNRPLPVNGASVSYNQSNSSVTIHYSMNDLDKNNGSLVVKVSKDNGTTWNVADKSSYTDSNFPKGGARTYTIAVFYDSVMSAPVTVSCALPTNLDVSKGGGEGTYNDYQLELYVGQTANFSANPYRGDGQKVTAGGSVSVKSDDGSVAEVSGSNSFSVTGKKVGTTKVRLSCNGITKTITVVVRQPKQR